MTAKVFHAELWGKRQVKNDALNAADIENTTWEEIAPQKPFYLFIPQDVRRLGEYDSNPKITEVMPLYGTGIITKRDKLAIHFEADGAWETIRKLDKLPSEEAREHFSLPQDVRDWRVDWAKADIRQSGPNRDLVKPVLYRPFDIRYTYYTGNSRGFLGWPVKRLMRHMAAEDNLGLITSRLTKGELFRHVQVTRTMSEVIVMSPTTSNNGFLFPVYLYPDPDHPAGRTDEYWPAGKNGRRPNLNPDFVKDMEGKLGLTFVSDGCGDLKKPSGHGTPAVPGTFGPEDVFHYMYAVFHNPTYRSRYAEFLKIDFPRLPLTSNVQLFVKLCGLGAELTGLHLLESPALANPPVRYPVKGDDTVAKGYPKYVPADSRVHINAKQYFEPVDEEVWEFHVGGYQVCQKWLKDRRGRKLSYDDITHYRKVVIALGETIRLMAEIDAAIPAWPIK